MRVLQINSNDYNGVRFSGISVRGALEQRGIDSKHYLWRREHQNPNTIKAYDVPLRDAINNYLTRLETAKSLQSTLYRQWITFPYHTSYRWADIIHYHIIHDGFFSMDLLPWLTRRKPSVWTLHDPWAMTGHCIHPMGCERWKIGCGNCPDLTLPFAIKKDTTHEHFLRKQKAYKRTKADLIVSSQWMYDFVKASPLTRHFDTHIVPFGIDTDRFKPRPPEEARRKLGILPGRFVIFFRAFNSVHKGLPYIREAIGKLKTRKPVTILTAQEVGHFEVDLGRHQVIELGILHNEDEIVDAFTACDLFLMPSMAESFGVMAIEAMASGKPVICFEGTALPSVTGAPGCGIAVPSGDSQALADAIDRLIDNEDELLDRARLVRQYAEDNYSLDVYADRLKQVYSTVIAKRKMK